MRTWRRSLRVLRFDSLPCGVIGSTADSGSASRGSSPCGVNLKRPNAGNQHDSRRFLVSGIWALDREDGKWSDLPFFEKPLVRALVVVWFEQLEKFAKR